MATTAPTGGATTTIRSAVLRNTTTAQLTGVLRGIEVGTSLQLRTERDGIEVLSAVVTVTATNAAQRSVTVGAAFSATVDFPSGAGVLPDHRPGGGRIDRRDGDAQGLHRSLDPAGRP